MVPRRKFCPRIDFSCLQNPKSQPRTRTGSREVLRHRSEYAQTASKGKHSEPRRSNPDYVHQTTSFPSPFQCMFIAVRPTEAITVVNGGCDSVSRPKRAPGDLQTRIFTPRGTIVASVLCEAMLIAKIHHADSSDSIRIMGGPRHHVCRFSKGGPSAHSNCAHPHIRRS